MPEERSPATRLDELKSREAALVERRPTIRILYYVAIVLVLSAVIATISHAVPGKQSVYRLFATLIIALATLAFLLRWRVRLNEEELRDVRFELELEQFARAMNDRERRAEKLLRISNLQLREYYDLGLSQNYWIFALGVLCILLGGSILIATVYLVVEAPNLGSNEKIIVAVTGFVSSAFSNLVAAFFMRMHAAANRNFNSFHVRLVANHQLLLGNLLVAGINDEARRSTTLSQLALSLAGNAAAAAGEQEAASKGAPSAAATLGAGKAGAAG